VLRTLRRALFNIIFISSLIYLVLLVVLSVIHMLFPQRSGLLALTQVFAPYLFIPVLPIVPMALIRRPRRFRVALVIALALCAILFLVRFPPRLIAAPNQERIGEMHLSAMAWNVFVGGRHEAVRSLLVTRPADIVALEEISWEWIDSDKEITRLYPYRSCIYGDDPIGGLCLLSVYPILEDGIPDAPPGIWDKPRVIWARLDLGAGRILHVIVAHPPPPYIARAGFPMIGPYDTSKRDARIAYIRAFIEPYLQRGEPVLVLGDFNVTEREVAYTDLTQGLLDAYRLTGDGIGHTWGSRGLLGRWVPVLRIDYLLSSPDVIPLAASVDCTERGSDHCIVRGRFELK